MFPLAVAIAASTALSPQIGYEWSRAEEGVTWMFRTDTSFGQANMTVGIGGVRGYRSTVQRGVWNAGDVWEIQTADVSRGGTYEFDLTAVAGDESFSQTLRVELPPAPSLEVTNVLSSLEDGHFELRYRTSDALSGIEVVELLPGGEAVPADLAIELRGGGRDVSLTWTSAPDALRSDIVFSSLGGASVREVWTWWSLEGELRRMNFATGSAELAPADLARVEAEAVRLREAAAEVADAVDVQLYVGGYTDTVGSASSNRALSLARARSVAVVLRAAGLDLPVFVQGFGEEALAEQTADGEPSAENRRVVFVLRNAPPPTDGNFPRGDWRELP